MSDKQAEGKGQDRGVFLRKFPLTWQQRHRLWGGTGSEHQHH